MDGTERRVERLEERLGQAERDVTSLTTELRSAEKDAEKNRVDLRERLDDLKTDIKEEIEGLSDQITVLSTDIKEVGESLQNVYITQEGSNTKVNTNEKIIWAVVALIGSGALYLIQSFIKAGGLG